MEKTDRIIKYIREMMAVGAGGFTGSADAEGPVAGYDPLIKFQKKGKTDYRKVPKTYKSWVKSLEKSNVGSRKQNKTS
jgi:hypothetical protein